MDDTETKSCPNCKREIPAVNFTIHSVHCARNIKVCPVCKEPVPLADLQLHHDQMHKLLPCKKCGESVCGTDLEDHIRDSCAHTIKSCKFCSLELPRRELPTHEGYCGARTEQCSDCREWVMLKYRQLHLDSNHGFLRLDDDPDPKPTQEVPKSRIPKVPNPVASLLNGPNSNVNINGPSSSNGTPDLLPTSAAVNNRTRNAPLSSDSAQNVASTSNDRFDECYAKYKKGNVKNTNAMRDRQIQNTLMTSTPPRTEIRRITPGSSSGTSGPSQPKNTNQAQENASQRSAARKTTSRGAVKKRAAPAPPAADPRRDLPFYSALQRQQDADRQRQEINAERLQQGLPPLLTTAEKVERLRKMDALHNREQEVDYSNRLQGRVWGGDPPPSPAHSLGVPSARNDLRDLKPMSPEQFLRRFNALQMGQGQGEEPVGGNEARRDDNDRFSMIKSSLRELRRGLNEVTAPYNSNSIVPAANEPRVGVGEAIGLQAASSDSDDNDDVHLPCEFCGLPQPIDILVQHQTGCRPDLARLLPTMPPRPAELDAEPPVIPCEFCAQSLPVYLISEHQERCGRDAHPLYLD